MNKSVYVSLPIDSHGFNVEAQKRKAYRIQRKLEDLGYTVSNPFEIYKRLVKYHERCGMNPPTRKDIMREDITELLANDMIMLCDKWDVSKGCLEEAEVATQFANIKVVFERTFNFDIV